ncbi:hypothetical protein BJV77DRAFT_53129 [Russula vinacea]|nr:hypothetical protein BJV77DRAFT_53129 [Russula vinacea]
MILDDFFGLVFIAPRTRSENSSRSRRSCSRSRSRRSDSSSGNSSAISSSGVAGLSASSSAFQRFRALSSSSLSHSRASASRLRVCLSRSRLSLDEPFDLSFFISVTLLLDAGSSTKEYSWFRKALASFSACLRAATSACPCFRFRGACWWTWFINACAAGVSGRPAA